MAFKRLMDRAKAMLAGRKPMGQNRRARPKRKGPAGESRDVRLHDASPMGKAQARSRKTQSVLDQLD